VKPKKSNNELDKAALAAVTKEMDQPRFVQSARDEEEAVGHQVISRKK